MPVQIIEANDPITAMVEFRTSAVYEMLVSLHTLILNRRHLDWIAAAQTALGSEFVAEVAAFYEPLCQGTLLFELAVDYPDHDDVPGFIEYVQRLDSTSLLFYLIGRVLPRERIARIQHDPKRLLNEAREVYPSCAAFSSLTLRTAFADIPTFQARLVRLWQDYWDGFFHSQIADLPLHWSQATAEKERLLTHYNGKGLLEAVTGKTELPQQFPPEATITELVFIPIFFASAQSYVFFGYGNMTVLFDSERTEARVSQINQSKERALETAKALSDNTRLGILRLIADHHDGIHGKRIASKLNLSPSAVSRQLAQLRDSGLIVEEPHDDQTVTYKLIEATIKSLPDQILEYLYS